LRRFLIFVILVLLLITTYQLSRMAQDWHYIVSGEPGELLYATSFDSGDDWELYEGLASAQVIDGRMQINIDNNDLGIYSAVSPYFADFDLQLQAQALDGPENNAYGAIFRQRDRENYYTFYISSDGFYRVSRVYDGQTKVLSNWHFSPIINIGINALNDVRVIGHNDKFQFLINQTPVELCIPDDPNGESTPLGTGECLGGAWQAILTDDSISFGRVGVAVEIVPDAAGSPIVAFDNVLVYASDEITQ